MYMQLSIVNIKRREFRAGWCILIAGSLLSLLTGKHRQRSRSSWLTSRRCRYQSKQHRSVQLATQGCPRSHCALRQLLRFARAARWIDLGTASDTDHRYDPESATPVRRHCHTNVAETLSAAKRAAHRLRLQQRSETVRTEWKRQGHCEQTVQLASRHIQRRSHRWNTHSPGWGPRQRRSRVSRALPWSASAAKFPCDFQCELQEEWEAIQSGGLGSAESPAGLTWRPLWARYVSSVPRHACAPP